jgi:succinate dehydrogenase / fumarate reductase, membrane anchor subunit
MKYRSALARVEGLGSAHQGTAHFWQQRVSAVALVPLAIWFVVSALRLANADYLATLDFLRAPVNAILMILFVVTLLYHMALGIQVVIEDYVHSEGQKILLLMFNRFFAWGVGAVCLFSIFRIAI